ncbi:MAG: metallophosphoesterase [Aliidongia sp.]
MTIADAPDGSPEERPEPEEQGRNPSVPEDSRIYVVGDIHGCLDLLATMHRLILADAAEHEASRRVVVYLGDYIDRGPDSKGVVDLLIGSPLPGFESIHLKGNHEQALLDFLEDIAIGPDCSASAESRPSSATASSHRRTPSTPTSSPRRKPPCTTG